VAAELAGASAPAAWDGGRLGVWQRGGGIGAIGLAQNLGSTTISRHNPRLNMLPMKSLGRTTRLAPGADCCRVIQDLTPPDPAIGHVAGVGALSTTAVTLSTRSRHKVTKKAGTSAQLRPRPLNRRLFVPKAGRKRLQLEESTAVTLIGPAPPLGEVELLAFFV
jgi:hypothetical protein